MDNFTVQFASGLLLANDYLVPAIQVSHKWEQNKSGPLLNSFGLASSIRQLANLSY
jgi:hypothetical protein